jgi:hypothetical protein
MQPSVHERLGAIGLIGPFLVSSMWAAHYEEAAIAFGEFESHEQELLATPVNEGSATRDVSDEVFIAKVYRTGVRAVLSSVLALQHLTAEIEIVTGAKLGGHDLGGRISVATKAIGFRSHTELPGWPAIPELENVRHAIEHPSAENLYSFADWTRVPRAWMFSDRPLKVWPQFQLFFEAFADRWLTELASRPRETRTVSAQRGMRSLLQYKKPRPEA